MGRTVSAECYLFDAPPEHAIQVVEAAGAVRSDEYPWTWHYPSHPSAQLSFGISVRDWPDAERTGIGTTLFHEMLADMELDQEERWLQAVAAAFHISTGDAHVLVTERARVIVRCHLFDPAALPVLRTSLVALMAAEGAVWSGMRGWSSRSVVTDPSSLEFDAGWQ